MERLRSSSIPRQYHRTPRAERFTVTDAVHLKLKLQALDAAISSEASEANRAADIQRLLDACQLRPSYETVYIDGSEEFYLLVKGVSRPDLIPHVYVEAYKATLQGRYHVNEYRVSDFMKGVDPTFSEVRLLLGKIDLVCETDLEGSYRRLEDKVKPFPFLRLPPELRLQVYSHLMPREPHIAILLQPTRDHCAPRLRLDVMRVSSQIHDETRKYLYENRTLFLLAAQEMLMKSLDNACLARCSRVLASMNPQTRQLFKKFDIQVEYVSHDYLLRKFAKDSPCVTDPTGAIFSLLPSVETLVISLCSSRHALAPTHVLHQNLTDAANDLIESAPLSVNIIWDLTYTFPPGVKRETHLLWKTIQSRGSIGMGAGVLTQLEDALARPCLI